MNDTDLARMKQDPKQEDNDQIVFDLDVNLLKVVPGVTSGDKSVTIKVLSNEDESLDYDLTGVFQVK
jgi:hypothetical protein